MPQNITLYNVNMRKNRRDRFAYEDPLILKQTLDSFVKTGEYTDDELEVSIRIDSDTRMSVRLPRKEGADLASVTYLHLDSTFVFPNKSANGTEVGTFWFVTSTVRNISSDYVEYSCELDSISTYGVAYLSSMTDYILVSQRHESRFSMVKNNVTGKYIMKPNDECSGLIQSDFRLDDTQGQKLEYYPILPKGSGGNPNLNPVMEYNLTVDGQKFFLRHGTKDQNGQTWYHYAILQIKGKPNFAKKLGIVGGSNGGVQAYTVNSIDSANAVALDQIYQTTGEHYWGIGFDNYKFIVPVGLAGVDNTTDSVVLNSMADISNIEEGKVLQVFKSPYPIKAKDSGDVMFQFVIGDEDELKTVDTVTKLKTELLKEDTTLLFGFPAPYDEDYETSFNSDFNVSEMVFNDSDAFPFTDPSREIELATKDDLRNILNDKFMELGLWNGQIIRNELHFKGAPSASLELDLYRRIFGRYVDNQSYDLKWHFGGNDTGVNVNVNIWKYHFSNFDIQTQVNSYSDAGKTFINNNRYYMDAQKNSIHVQADLQRKQARASSGSNVAGGIISSIFTLGIIGPSNIASGAAEGSFANNEMYDTENAQKAVIDAQAKDASSAPASINHASGNDWMLLNDMQLTSFAVQVMRLPNNMITEKIRAYMERFGYPCNRYIATKPKWWENRILYNYIRLEDPSSFYINDTNKFNSAILDDIEQQLKTGVRL